MNRPFNTLFLAGLFFVAINVLAAFLPQKNWSHFVRTVPFFWNTLGQKPLDWLVLGDSIPGCGISPQVLEKELGGACFNAATYAGHNTLKDAWITRRYFESQPRLKAVLIVHGLHVWNSSSDDYDWALLPLRDSFTLEPRPKIPFEKIIPLFLMRSVTIDRWQVRFPPLVSPAPGRNIELTGTGFRPAMARRWNFPKSGPVKIWLPGETDALSSNALRMLASMNALAEEKGFDIFIAHQPVWKEALADDAVYAAKVAEAHALLRRTAASFSRVHFLEADTAVPARYFNDENHLYYPGAVYYSTRIAAALKAIWARP